MQETEQQWVREQFSKYFNPLGISLLNQIDSQRMLLGETHIIGKIHYVTMFCPEWTKKHHLSDALVIIGIRERKIIAAGFTRLKHQSQYHLEAQNWVAVKEPGTGLGSSIINVRNQLFAEIAQKTGLSIRVHIIDKNHHELQKSTLTAEERTNQRAKWEKAMQKAILSFDGSVDGNHNVSSSDLFTKVTSANNQIRELRALIKQEIAG